MNTRTRCPFCGKQNSRVNGELDCWWIECVECNSTGPTKDSAKKAGHAWHFRAVKKPKQTIKGIPVLGEIA